MKMMINLGQAEYIGTKALKWFGMEESKLLMTPLDLNIQFNKEQTLGSKREIVKMGKRSYNVAIGFGFILCMP